MNVASLSLRKGTDLREDLARRTGKPTRLFRAPGRVNLIGEHTDYNGGFVMPIAISKDTYVAAAARDDDALHIASRDLAGEATVPLPHLVPQGAWWDYVTGVAAALTERGFRPQGADLLVASEVPLGAGLSSSAALEIASALALLASQPRPWSDAIELAKVGQQAEHRFVGTQCGLMDQFIAVFGRRGNALLLDCRSLHSEPIPLPPGLLLAICNTGVRHELASSAYNQRRAECAEGVRLLQQDDATVQQLRDVSLTTLERARPHMADAVYRRCRHIVSENARVLATAEALRGGRWETLGPLLAASHASLRDDFEVSCRELDVMVEIAEQAPGFVAGRMTGGGFGGCTVNLVHTAQGEAFAAHMGDAYQRATGLRAEIYLVESADGASEITAG